MTNIDTLKSQIIKLTALQQHGKFNDDAALSINTLINKKKQLITKLKNEYRK